MYSSYCYHHQFVVAVVVFRYFRLLLNASIRIHVLSVTLLPLCDQITLQHGVYYKTVKLPADGNIILFLKQFFFLVCGLVI